jgi:hypothetical protein
VATRPFAIRGCCAATAAAAAIVTRSDAIVARRVTEAICREDVIMIVIVHYSMRLGPHPEAPRLEAAAATSR